MALTRVKSGGWANGERFYHYQANELDENAVAESVRLDTEIAARVAADTAAAAAIAASRHGAQYVISGIGVAAASNLTLTATLYVGTGYTLASNQVTVPSAGIYLAISNVTSYDVAATGLHSITLRVGDGTAVTEASQSGIYVPLPTSLVYFINDPAVQKIRVSNSGLGSITVSGHLTIVRVA